ncbi:uncharacterized protein LOC124160787 [Ischnura elegans]|uniref:uncharacterized protein LOC124160787 n=1 Tax=Ischnura elegans TaxID=197161 RepID=UPI001ED86AE3|nr:uncharacterized protein LOC124160787 [Ischnura elegans]
MADDKKLSMSLDEIIKLNRASSRGSSSQSSPRARNKTGARGKANFAVYRRRGRVGMASNRNSKRGGIKTNVSYRIRRGGFRIRGFRGGQRNIIGQRNYAEQRNLVGQRNLPLRIEDRIRQRQLNIALARSRLQMAKKFLNNRQRIGFGTRVNMGSYSRVQYRRTPRGGGRGASRGRGRGSSRGRGGLNIPSSLLLNSFRSNHLARINMYQNKVNRSQSAAMRNQVPAAPSLIVSIENERAGTPAISGIRTGRRGLRKRGGNLGIQHVPTMQLTNDVYQPRNSVPFHTGALNPEIQRMIADIQGKPNPSSGRIPLSQRGFGATRGKRGMGRGHFLARQMNGRAIDGLNVGIPKTTACTLNERFGGRM